MIDVARALVVAAHPDDEVLGCGGTIAKLEGMGVEVSVLIVAEGITSRQPRRDADSVAEEISALRVQSRKALEVFGTQRVDFLGFPDNRLDGSELLDLVKEIERVATVCRPEMVLTHWTHDLNIDHAIVSRAVQTAFRPLPEEDCRLILEWETPSSTEWSVSRKSFNPNVFINIEHTLEKKIAALQCYRDEKRAFPHPRSEALIRALAQVRGSNCGYEAAEAFELRRLNIG